MLKKLLKLPEAIDVLFENQEAIRQGWLNLEAAHVKLAQKTEKLSGRVDGLSAIEVAAFHDPRDEDVRKLSDEVKELRRLVAKLVPVEDR